MKCHEVDIPARRGETGVTILEVLIAIIVLSAGLLGMASLTMGIVEGNRLSNELTTATTLAQDKMEELAGAAYINVIGETKAALPSPYGAFKREVLVANNSPTTGMKVVVVKVYWGGKSGEDHNVELRTILAR